MEKIDISHFNELAQDDPEHGKAQEAILAELAKWEPEKQPVAEEELRPPPARPPPDLSRPATRSAPRPVDSELAEAQKVAQQRRDIGALGQTITDIGNRPDQHLSAMMRLGGAGGMQPVPKSDYWQQYGAEGDRAVADLMARRKSEAAMSKAESDAEMRDPNSQSSQFARTIIGKYAPQLAQQLEGKSAEEIARFQSWISKFVTDERAGIAAKMNLDAKQAESAKRNTQREEDMALKAAQRAEDMKISADRFERTDSRAREGAAASREMARASLGMRQGEVESKRANDINDDVQKLGKELPGDVADFGNKYTRIKAAMAANPGDIPGVGAYDARKPKWFSSKDDFDVQKDAGQMLAAYQKLITGAGASDAERANLAKISLDLTNEASFASGLESLKSAYDAKVKDVRARFRPEVVQKLEEGQRREGLGVPGHATAPASAAGTKTIGGVPYEKRADGKWHPVGGE